ncbi:MAG: TonB-dependent siderophore receptor [Thermodesulfobacteriota bacterium]
MSMSICRIAALMAVSLWVCQAFPAIADELESLSGYRVSDAAPTEPATSDTGDKTGSNGSEETSGEVQLPEVTVSGQKEDAGETEGYITEDATTATKTDMPIFDTPVSIQVVPQDVLQDQQAIRVRDAVKNVSGVYVRPAGGDNFEDFFVRGFPLNFQIFRDGFRTRGFNLNLSSVERVEVLKGPAAVLYGRVEPGGLINLISKEPLPVAHYSVEQQFGSYELFRTTADLTGPLLKENALLYRFNFNYENSESFRDFVDSEEFYIAPTLVWNIGDSTYLRFSLEYLNGHSVPDRGLIALGDRPAPLPISRYLGEPFNGEKLEDLLLTFLGKHDFNENWTLRLRFSFEKPENHPVEVFPTDFFLEDGQSVERFFFEEVDDGRFYYATAELVGRFNTWCIRHNVLFGVEYYDNDIDFKFAFTDFPPINIYDPVYGAPRPDVTLAPGDRGLKWYGVYAQDQVYILENLILLAGIRYDYTESFFNCCGEDAVKVKDKPDDWSPRVGLLWQPMPWLSLYGNYTDSFSATDVFNNSFSGEPLEPETATQYEAGMKAEFFESRLMGTLAFYRLTKKNILTDDPEHPGFLLNIGEARSQGIELDVTGNITPAVSVIASYAYTDTEILEDNTGNEGNRLPGVPENGGSVFGKYEFLTGVLRGLSLGSGVFFVGEREGDAANSFEVPSYTRIDLLGSYRYSIKKFGGIDITAQINIENLFDERYFLGAQDRSSILPGAPRTVLAAVGVEF